MQVDTQITFRDIEPSPAIEDHIREKAAWLEHFCADIVTCRVVVEAPHRHHHQGKLFHVRVRLTVPDAELVVSREPAEHHAHEDVYVAIRDAFDAARRKLEDYERRRRGMTKEHVVPLHGRVARLFADEGYGFIETADGREVYFHRNSVVDGGFDRLEIGAEVRFDEEEGARGPQATTVHPVGKHHPVG